MPACVCVGDTRETASSFVCANLLEERANLHVYDPKVTREQMFIEFKVHPHPIRSTAASELTMSLGSQALGVTLADERG